MIVSGVKDYRVAYKSYQDWLVPRYAVLSIFFVGLVFVIVGFILLLIGATSGFASAGAVFLGLGLSLHAICLLLCLHAYCIRYIRDQSTQTKDAESLEVKEVTTPTQVIVTSKPPQGVLRTGRSPSTEPKRVRLQAERDTGFSGGQTQSLSSQLLTDKFPLRTPEWKEEQQQTQVKQGWSKSQVAAENHYETLPLKVEVDTAASRRPGEVFSPSQEADGFRQVSASHVVYPQQAKTFSVTSFEAPPPPAYPPPSTHISSYSTSSAYRSGSPSFQHGQSILTSPHPLSGGQFRQSSEQHYQTGYQSGHQTGYQSGLQTGHQSGHQTGYQSGLQTGHQSGHQTGYQSGHQTGYQSGHQSAAGGSIQHYHAPTQARAASSTQQYHVTSDTRPIKIEQHYHTAPASMAAQQRQMASEYHWSGMGAHGSAGGTSAGQDMTFEDHRSSKMSLYDNLNGWTDGGATI